MSSEHNTSQLQVLPLSPRIRHLKSVSLRNLSFKANDVQNLNIFFTLHNHTTEFYKSYEICGTVNPAWEDFDLSSLPFHYLSTSFLVIRFWTREGNEDARIHIEYELDLRHLNPLLSKGDTQPDRSIQHSDYITFTLFDNMTVFELTESSTAVNARRMAVCNQPTKASYTVNLLKRLMVVLRALKQTEQSVETVRVAIETRLQDVHDITKKREGVESFTVRLNEIKEKCEILRNRNALKRQSLLTRRSETNRMEKEMNSRDIVMRDDDSNYTAQKRDYISNREKLLKVNALLSTRQKQLVYELSLIYPIEEVEEGKFTIAGIHLPTFDNLLAYKEMTTSTAALGHCAHMVLMMSRFLGTPLQHPIIYRGSRSLIFDNIKPSSLTAQQKDVSFPLYYRNKDRQAFQYAMHLLNKNIANMRNLYGMHTKDLKLTLRNLKDFLINKFGVGVQHLSLKPAELLSAPAAAVYRTRSVPALNRSAVRDAKIINGVRSYTPRATESPQESNEDSAIFTNSSINNQPITEDETDNNDGPDWVVDSSSPAKNTSIQEDTRYSSVGYNSILDSDGSEEKHS